MDKCEYVGKKVICENFNSAIKICEKTFPNFWSNGDIQQYVSIIGNIVNTPLTVKSISYDRYFKFEEKDIAPDKFNYPIDMFDLYVDDNEAVNQIPCLFGIMQYQN